MKIILSNNISDIFEKSTKIPTIALKPYERLDIPVRSHPDMLLFVIDKTVFCYKEYYIKNKELFNSIKNEKYNIIPINKECGMKYPEDIALNVLKIGNTLFGKRDCIAKEILEYAKKHGYSFVDVKQGYAACATLVLNSENAITADTSIKNALEKCGKNVTFISEDKIVLSGYNCGFIGGASAVIDDCVYFFGDINSLKSKEKIVNTITSLNMKIFSVSSGGVYDFGGAKII